MEEHKEGFTWCDQQMSATSKDQLTVAIIPTVFPAVTKNVWEHKAEGVALRPARLLYKSH